MSSYQEVYQKSVEKPEEFWAEAASKLHWYKKWEKVLDDSNAPFYRWFVGGKTNLCYNAVDRHALGSKRGQAAIIWESPETGQSRILTYYQLYKEVNRFAGVLKNLGVGKGDRVLIYLPMVVEAAIAMLACVRIGAIHSVVFAGFSYNALADRIDDAQPKVVLLADAGHRNGKPVPLKGIVDKALETAKHKVDHCIILNRGIAEFDTVPGRDLDWETALAEKGENYVEPEEMDSTDPSYILYTSGTTGKPKGVLRDTGGYMVALHNSMEQIYDVGEGDVYFSTSDIGWVVGHSYIIYAPLLKGVTTIIYEGTPIYPDPSIWWQVVEKYGVTHVFSAPTAMRILRKYPEEHLKSRDVSSLKYLFLAGEPLDDSTWKWASDALGVKVIDHYWQTETGWPILSNMPGVEALPIKPGSPTKPVVGYKLKVVDANGDPVPKGQKGFLVVEPPLPPGNLMTIWGDDARYKNSYFGFFQDKLLYMTGDYGIEDEDGYFWVLGRADEVINVAGHRLGTREVEEVISSHPAVAEGMAIGVKDEVKGQAIICLVVLKEGREPSEEISKAIINLVREKIGPVATPKEVKFVKMLPKTRSGKIMRRVIKAVAEGEQIGDLSTLEDGASIEEVKKAIESMKAQLG
ncbi:propionate--CoA ligase [Calderihabitans maritimus]|uniref:Acetate--CoA ligase n=1 Tax=Calderihabitans maritimus TaxID=1246530 RepID=A0A1Z5HW11_9FIRM|nr:propionate--CoA ligase [Calderihabitans maritimus]GAW93722.1 AMP-dependent synthetase and ligase [Calderihabitans maritimus]